MMTIPFTKMVGAGNDFIIVDTRRNGLAGLKTQWQTVAKVLCDRRVGIGADGVLVLEPSKLGNVTMRVFNLDGTEANMCGNGARCVALYLASKKPTFGTGNRRQETGKRQPRVVAKETVMIETKAGILSAMVRGDRVALQMTDPTDLRLGVAVPVGRQEMRLGCVNTGVPHVVVPVGRLDRVDVDQLGRALRFHPQFSPNGTNVNFIQADPQHPNRLRVRTYERGVEEETLACGTGVAASAVVYALTKNGQMASHHIEVDTRSGERLDVSFQVAKGKAKPRISHLVLEGSAKRIFDGTISWPPRHCATAFGRWRHGGAAADRWVGCRPTRGVVTGATGSARGAPHKGDR